jgi:DNA-binding IclR family transcriptional regulator
MKKPKSEYQIQTVANALRVLEEFRTEAEIGVAELSRRLGLHKNNVFRLLATLEEQGYIEQDPITERYRLGLAALELGRAFARSHPLLERCRPVLDTLAQATLESVHLGMLQNFEVVHVHGVTPDRLLLTQQRVGLRLPAHCTALGKVLVGCSPDGQREAFERTTREPALEKRTLKTIIDSDKFLEHIRTVAGQGYALDLEECEDGLVCVAAPVHEASGRVAAAISLSAPSARVTEEVLIREIAPQVVEAAEGLSRELGYVVPA